MAELEAKNAKLKQGKKAADAEIQRLEEKVKLYHEQADRCQETNTQAFAEIQRLNEQVKEYSGWFEDYLKLKDRLSAANAVLDDLEVAAKDEKPQPTTSLGWDTMRVRILNQVRRILYRRHEVPVAKPKNSDSQLLDDIEKAQDKWAREPMDRKYDLDYHVAIGDILERRS